jgi:hypothetical protein
MAINRILGKRGAIADVLFWEAAIVERGAITSKGDRKYCY